MQSFPPKGLTKTSFLRLQRLVGITTFRISNRVARVLPLRRRYLVSVHPPSRSTSNLFPFWAGPLRRLSPFSLTTIDGSSLVLTLQPSLAPHSGTSPEITPDPLAGISVPAKVATLSERLARDRYQPRTALRLPVAEHRASSTLGREGWQLLTRPSPRTYRHRLSREKRCRVVYG